MFNVGYRIRSLTDTEQAAYTAGSEIVVTMPPPNPWIPATTEVHTTEVVDPARRLDSEGWVSVAPDARWKTPRTITQLELHMSADGVEDLDAQVLGVLYDVLLSQHLIDFRYPIDQASSGITVDIRSVRFLLRVDSWSDVHTALIDATLAEVRAFEPTLRRFEAKKTDCLRIWRNQVHEGPIARIAHGPKDAIGPESRSTAEWIEALEAIEFEDLQRFVQDYWRPGRPRMVSFGDTSDTLTLTARDHLLRHAEVEPVDAVHDYEQVRWYPKGVSRTHEVAVDHDDSAVWMMYQGSPGIPTDARWTLLGDLLGQPYYNELRTKQQLGYSVALWGAYALRAPSIRLELQSSVAGPTVLLDRVEAFLQDSPALLAAMDAEEFATARDALAERWREPASTFQEQWWRIWESFTWGDTEGVYGERLANAIATVSQDEVVTLARALFATDSPTRIVAWTVGRAHAGDPLKGTADCADRACLAEGMQVVFTQDFGGP
jgi:secreted Zn-dependent insulinase-like peptidase